MDGSLGDAVARGGQALREDRPRRSRRSSRRGLWVGVLAALMVMGGAALLPGSAHARGRRVVPNLEDSRAVPGVDLDHVVTIGVTVHMPTEGGVPLTTRRKLAQWVERANVALQPHGLRVELRQVVSMVGYTEVTRRRDRRRLATMTQHDGTIHVFVTETLDNETVGTRVGLRRRVRGLHWRYMGLNRQLRQREFVMVTLGAPKTTFAHEVGHLLGLRHSTSEDNIMCSCRKGQDTRFSIDQGMLMKQGATRFKSRQRQARQRELDHRARNLDQARRRR